MSDQKQTLTPSGGDEAAKRQEEKKRQEEQRKLEREKIEKLREEVKKRREEAEKKAAGAIGRGGGEFLAQKDYDAKVDAMRKGSDSSSGSESDDVVYISSINNKRGVARSQIQQRGINVAELYGKDSHTSSMSENYGLSSNDMQNLIQSRDITKCAEVRYKVNDAAGEVARVGTSTAYRSMTSGSDFGASMSFANELGTLTVGIAAQVALNSMSKAVNKDLAKSLNKINKQYGVYGKNTIVIANEELGVSSKELKKLQAELMQKLRKNGMGNFNFRGNISNQQIMDYLVKNGSKMTEAERGALKMLAQVNKAKMMNDLSKANLRKIRRVGFQVLSRNVLGDSDAGESLRLLTTVTRRAGQTLRYGSRFLRMTARIAKLGGKLAMRAAAAAAARLARTKLAQALANAAKKTGKRVAATKPMRKLGRASKRLGTKKNLAKRNMNRLRNRLRNSKLGRGAAWIGRRFRRVGGFLRDPFGLRGRFGAFRINLRKRYANSFLVKLFSPFRFIKKMFASIITAIMTIVSAIITVVIAIVVTVIAAVIVILVILFVINVIIEMFDFSKSEKEIREAAFAQIKTCYESQMKNVQNLNGVYSNVRITTEDIKDEEAYQMEDHQPETPFTQTTNCAEIMSMTQVYFDFDLEEAGQTEVCNYVKRLYNGSHDTIVKTTSYTLEGADGKKYTVMDADVTLKTHYFNSIFDCQLKDSSGFLQEGTITAGTEVNIPSDLIQCNTVTCYDNWILRGHPGWCPHNTNQWKVAEEWINQGCQFDDGLAYINVGGQKRYLVATTCTFGKVGDYVDVYYNDGDILPCILADMKSTGDSNYSIYGHMYSGNTYSIVEFEVEQAVYLTYGNPGGYGWRSDLNPRVKRIVKIRNGGSWISNRSGPA